MENAKIIFLFSIKMLCCDPSSEPSYDFPCTFKGKKSGSEVINFFFMLDSVEHEILNAHKYKKYQENWLI